MSVEAVVGSVVVDPVIASKGSDIVVPMQMPEELGALRWRGETLRWRGETLRWRN